MILQYKGEAQLGPPQEGDVFLCDENGAPFPLCNNHGELAAFVESTAAHRSEHRLYRSFNIVDSNSERINAYLSIFVPAGLVLTIDQPASMKSVLCGKEFVALCNWGEGKWCKLPLIILPDFQAQFVKIVYQQLAGRIHHGRFSKIFSDSRVDSGFDMFALSEQLKEDSKEVEREYNHIAFKPVLAEVFVQFKLEGTEHLS